MNNRRNVITLCLIGIFIVLGAHFVFSQNSYDFIGANRQYIEAQRYLQGQAQGQGQSATTASNKPFTESLTSYLKRKYLGVEIKVEDSNGMTVGQSKPKELVLNTEGYYFVLEDGNTRVKIVFEGYLIDHISQLTPYSEHLQQTQLKGRLEAEKAISSMIKPLIAEDGKSSESYQPYSNYLNNQQNDQDKMRIETVSYYDLRSKENKMGQVVVMNDKIFLEGRIPINIRFERT